MDLSPQQDPQQSIKREFGLSTWSVNNKTSVYIITLMITLFGLVAYINMPKEQFPEIVIPTVYVNTVYPGNSPVDIENLITRPIEKELKVVKGVKKISSTSAQDISAVVVEFNENVKIAKALQDVKDAVDKAKKDLPSDLDNDPRVMEVDFTEIPIMVINLSGDFEIDKLKDYAEYLEEEIETLSEVSKVEISGALDREIQVNCDPYKMEARKVTFGDIQSAIANENITVSSGDVVSNDFRRALRISGEFKTAEEIANIIIKYEDQNLVYLRDVAEVKDSYVERKSVARLATNEFATKGNYPVVSCRVIKKGGQNLINADAKINEILADAIANRFPPNLNIVVTENQADEMKSQIANLENSIIFGVILVVGVLLFFMGLRNAMFVGIAIPLSMLLSFMILSAMGITINIVVLFGLILALGMLVDNAIVVIENTYRLMEEGYPLKKAAKEGVGEVAIPIISSTATTLAAFVPLAFWGGILGEFMKYLPITLIVVLASSLFVGLVINPVIAGSYMKVEKKMPERVNQAQFWLAVVAIVVSIPLYFTAKTYTWPNLLMTFGLLGLGNIFLLKRAAFWFQDVVLVKLEHIYLNTLKFALSGIRPYLFFGGSMVVLVLSVMLFGANVPSVALFPENDPNYIYLYIEYPLGTDVKSTDEQTRKLEQKVFQYLAPHKEVVKSIVTNVGTGTGDPRRGPSDSQFTPHKSKITIAFVDYQKRNGASTAKLMRDLSLMMKEEPGVKIVTDKDQGGPPVGKPINIEVTGEDYLQLIKEAEEIKTIIERANIPGIDGLSLEVELGKPELSLNIDRDKARRYGASTGMLASTLRTAIYGTEASKLKDGEDEYPIQIRLQDQYRYDPNRLAELRMTFRDNKGVFHQIPVSSVATLDFNSTFGSVKRKDLDRMIAVSSNVVEGYNGNEIVAQIRAVLANHKLTPGYKFKFTGEQEEQAKSMAFLTRALGIAVFAIFLILVTQFNSVSQPFIIVGSIVFSTIGVFLGLFIFNDDFIIIMTGIGIISLAGVVVNNAIVLIDCANLILARKMKDAGMDEEAKAPIEMITDSLVEAGFTRLRPVLLTAITTVLGLVPLATGMNIDFFKLYAEFNPDYYIGGQNADFWGPMAWTVIYGLTFATFLTLVVVPVMYLLNEKLKRVPATLRRKA